MQPRLLAGLFALAIVFAAATQRSPAAAQTNPYFQVEVDERFTGGAPKNKIFSLFAISPVPRTTVNIVSKEKPGTIIINTKERRLYYLLGEGRAIRYGIGVGRDGFTWRGEKTVTAKKEWPDWTPPDEMLRRRSDLPRFMKGGPENPLGARAMYLGSTLYRIHGSNEPETIGTGVSSGCFRMINDDVIDLYNRVQLGTKVIVM